MGFMAGFADGFANSFNAMENRRQATKQDAFRIAYDSYLRKQAKYDEDAKQDQQWVASAKQIAADYGAPPEAWEHAYTMLKEGSSYEQAAERFGRTKFSRLASPAMAESAMSVVPGMADMTKQAGLTMDNTAKDAALDLTQPNEGQENPDLLGSITGAVGDIFDPKKQQERQFNQAGKAVMNATGIDQAQYEQVNAGYAGQELNGGYRVDGVTPKNSVNGGLPSDFKWTDAPVAFGKDGSYIGAVLPMGEGLYRLPNGQTITDAEVDQVMARDDYNARTAAGQQLDKDASPILARKTDAMVAIRGFQRLAQMGHENKAVLTQAGQMIPTFIQSGFDNIDAAMKQFNVDGDVKKAEQSLQAALAGEVSDGDANAAQATAFASLLTPIVFAYARANNGSGTLTAQDFKSAYDSILSSTDPTQFENNLRTIAGRMVEGINLDAKLGSQKNSYSNAQGWKLNTGAYDQIDSLYSDSDKNWMGAQNIQPPLDPTKPQPKPTWGANESLAKKLGVDVGTPVTIDDQGNIVPAK